MATRGACTRVRSAAEAGEHADRARKRVHNVRRYRRRCWSIIRARSSRRTIQRRARSRSVRRSWRSRDVAGWESRPEHCADILQNLNCGRRTMPLGITGEGRLASVPSTSRRHRLRRRRAGSLLAKNTVAMCGPSAEGPLPFTCRITIFSLGVPFGWNQVQAHTPCGSFRSPPCRCPSAR